MKDTFVPNEALVCLHIYRLIGVLPVHSNPHSDSEISDQIVDKLADFSLCSVYIYASKILLYI